MANDLVNLATGAGVALLVGNAFYHRKRAAQATEAAASARVALTTIDDQLGRLTERKGARRGDATTIAATAPATTPTRSEPMTAPAPKVTKPRPSLRRFDDRFAELGEGIPVPYLRALAWGESRLDVAARTGDARGLFQIVPVVLRDYNRRRGTSYQPRDLYEPDVNIAIAASALRTIIESYGSRHRDVPNLQEDWSRVAFVELLTFGWNAGWSESAGVGRVVRYMSETLGVRENVSIDSVALWAKHAGASRHLSNPSKVRYSKAIARRYFAERDRDGAERDATAQGGV